MRAATRIRPLVSRAVAVAADVGSAIVVVAGVVTAWLAVVHEDALVADDYYKQGLAINRTLAKQETAPLRCRRRAPVSDDGSPSGDPDRWCDRPERPHAAPRPSHPRGLDQVVVLERAAGGGTRRGSIRSTRRWTLLLEDPANDCASPATWRRRSSARSAGAGCR